MVWIILYYVSLFSTLLPLIGAIRYFKQLDKHQFVLFYYSIFLVIAQFFDSLIVRLGYTNFTFFEFFLVVELVFFIWFYNRWRPYNRSFMLGSVVFIVALLIVEYLQYFVYDNQKNVSYTFPLIIIFCVVQSAVMLLKTFDLSDTEFNKKYIFWIAFARLIYFMAILPFNIYFFIGDELKGGVLDLYRYTDAVTNHLANITLNTLLMYSFRCRS